MSGAEQKAVLAVRLAAILLPCYLVAEICALLEFLHVVSMSNEPRIKPGMVRKVTLFFMLVYLRPKLLCFVGKLHITLHVYIYTYMYDKCFFMQLTYLTKFWLAEYATKAIVNHDISGFVIIQYFCSNDEIKL